MCRARNRKEASTDTAFPVRTTPGPLDREPVSASRDMKREPGAIDVIITFTFRVAIGVLEDAGRVPATAGSAALALPPPMATHSCGDPIVGTP